MPVAVADFHDLVRLLEEHSDRPTELRRVLLSQDLLDLPRAVQGLAIAQRRTGEAITHLTERIAGLTGGGGTGMAAQHARRSQAGGVALVQDGTVDQESWDTALARS